MSAPRELFWCPAHGARGPEDVLPCCKREVRFVPAEPVVAWWAVNTTIAPVTTSKSVARSWTTMGYQVERLVSAGEVSDAE